MKEGQYTRLNVPLDSSIQLKTFHSHMRTLEDTITAENTAVHPYLAHTNSLMHNAVLTCKAAMSLDSSDVVGFKGDNIAANKNLDHQWTFKKTTKTPGRKRKVLSFG